MSDLRIFSKEFFSNYMFHPFDDDLSRGDKVKAFACSLGLGLVTFGLAHLGCLIGFGKKKYTLSEKSPGSSESRIDSAAHPILRSTSEELNPTAVERRLIGVDCFRGQFFTPFEINGHSWASRGPRDYYQENSTASAKDFADNIGRLENLSVVINLMTSEEKESNRDQFIYDQHLPEGIISHNFENWNDEQALNEEDRNRLFSMAKIAAQEIENGKLVFVHCRRGLQRTSAFIAIAELFADHREDIRSKSINEVKGLIVSNLMSLTGTAVGRYPTTKQLEMLLSDDFIRALQASATET